MRSILTILAPRWTAQQQLMSISLQPSSSTAWWARCSDIYVHNVWVRDKFLPDGVLDYVTVLDWKERSMCVVCFVVADILRVLQSNQCQQHDDRHICKMLLLVIAS